MDNGKPSGPKTKWWSRPSTDADGPAGQDDASPVADAYAAEGGAAVPAAGQPPVPMTSDGDFTPAPPATDFIPAPPAPRPTAPAAAAPAPAEAPDAPVGEPRAQPLHAPDEYSTPPYGGPGPWAPAPPVQRPVQTPAHGTTVPPPYAGTNGHGLPGPLPAAPAPAQAGGRPAEGYAPPSPPHPVPQQPAGPQPPSPHSPVPSQQGPQQVSQWLRYDPWGAPQQPLSHPGPGQGAADDRPRKGRRGTVLVGAALLALVAGGIGGGIGSYVERNGGLTTVELPQSGRDDGGRAPDSVAGIASSALPSVVTLHVSGSAESGTGTGFVLDGKGHILTNNHVVAPAGSTGDITVTFSGGESAPAEIVGKDSGYDLAVVKVTGVSGLKPLPLGNSDNVQVGDPVVAIGAPFDLSNTVTSGIISAKQRPITAGGEKGDGTDVSYVDALQTDAPINPGNSGGPLVDAEARVIGINSAIRAADSGSALDGGQSGSIGLGFAIPINQGKRVAEELINTGKATHPVIGVTLDMEFTGDGAKVGGKAAGGGAAVTEGGPADDAGIRAGDVITEVEGRRVHSGEELIVKIRAHRPGDRLALVLTRGGKDLSMTLTLGSADGT
ncbi:S1C family serine protease [Streptomyces sp. NPDC102402]|uniref:S1C family serine protease n=1 Tax=Streptomyces sp. NPDC102402 TaxID=3366169 RepID=UPI0037F81FE9